MRTSDFRYWRIVLKKSFWGGDQNFSGPLMRFARGVMRDHIVSHKNDHGASYGRYAVLQWWSRLKISFCEIFGVVQFSTFATLSALSGPRAGAVSCPLLGVKRRSSVARATQVRCCREVRQVSAKRTTLYDCRHCLATLPSRRKCSPCHGRESTALALWERPLNRAWSHLASCSPKLEP
jgi:hypothetical protein